MPVDLGDTEAVTYAQLMAANIRGARGRAHLSQAIVSQRMVALGHTAWRHYQTLGKTERAVRALAADEVLSLAIALETSISALMTAVEGDKPVALAGDVLIAPESVHGLAYGITDRTITWDGGKIAACASSGRRGEL